MDRRELGRLGEDRACAYLEELGFSVIGRNYHSRWGEIDVIAQNDTVLVFAEVKLRAEGALVGGLEAVNASKMKKIVRTAAVWLSENPSMLPVRFDVFEINTRKDRDGTVAVTGVVHIPSAFGAEVCGEVF